MKLLVQTTGPFQFLVEDTGELVRSHAASVVRPSPWLNGKIAEGKVEELGKVGDDATNADWDDTLKESEGNEELARSAFLSEFPVGDKDKASTEPQPLPTTNLTASKANPSGQTAGLSPDTKPGAPGTANGPGGPKDTNVPKPAAAAHKR